MTRESHTLSALTTATRRGNQYWLGALGAVVLLAFAWLWNARLRPEEKALVGTWYGTLATNGVTTIYRFEFLRSRRVEAGACSFSDIEPEEFGTDSGRLVAVLKSGYAARWRYADGTLAFDGSEGEPTISEKLSALVRTFRWPSGHSFHDEWRLTSRSADDHENVSFEIIRGDWIGVMIRVPEDFVLPYKPMTPKEALEWHRAKTK